MNKRKSILVTSGSKRLGKHISKFFVMNDWDLILHYNNSKVEAEETANELSIYSKNIKLYHADFTKHKDVENLIENLLLKEKHWVGLVNNAGLFEYDTGQDFIIEKLNRHMSVNFSTPAILIQALHKNIIKNKIAKNKNNMVLNIIDAKIEGLNPDYYSYTLSKLAMSGLTKMSALSYAPDLRVNAIAPGIILPAENQNKKEFIKSHKKNILKSSATIDDLYLALDFLTNSNSVTGHISLLDGGAHLAPPLRDVAIKWDANPMRKKIFIENLICNASVGVYENEKLNKQKIIISLEILLINTIKTDTDNLHDVADYGKFRRIILDVVNSKHFNLIETLADNLLKRIETFDKVKNIKIKISKPDIFNDCSVSYEISNYP